jgi:subtilisin family serine protease
LGGRGSWATAAVACVALALVGSAAAAYRGSTAPLAGALERTARLAGPVSRPPRPTGYKLRWSRQSRASRVLLATGGFHDDEAVVGLAPGTTAADVARRYRLSVVSADSRIHAAKLTGAADRLLELARSVGTDSALRYVDRDRAIRPAHRRDDPATTQVDSATGMPYEWPFAQVGVDRALNLTRGSSDILVGVVDTGASPVRDLAGKLTGGWYFGDEATDISDTEGHGTFVSSIIAGRNDDGFGLAGFCGACRIDMFKSVRTTDYSLATSLRRLVDDGVHIVNLSLGRQGTPSFVLADALNYAFASGVLVVASSGNDGAGDVSTPASWLQPADGARSYGLAVGASDATGARASFSNWGTHLSLLAPGSFNATCTVGIWAALPPVSTDFDSSRACARTFTDPASGERYGYASGTSFSAPEVAGVAALVWAARPELKNYEVADIVKQSAARPAGAGWTRERGWGVLDAARALELATGMPSADEVVLGAPGYRAAPRAGRRFAVSVAATWQDGVPLDGGSVHCTAVAAGHRIASLDGTLTAGIGSCAFGIPKWAARRRMSVSIAVADAAGHQRTRSLAVPVRK